MKSGYEFYLGKCMLPVTPQKLEIKSITLMKR